MNPAMEVRSRRAKTLRGLIGLLCIALVLLVGSVDLLHNHAALGGNDPACSLCTLTHVAALPGAVAHAPMVAESVSETTLALISAPPARSIHFSLYVRPPPVDPARSL